MTEQASERGSLARTIARLLLAFIMVYAGVAHFRNPAPFISIVPDWLPAHAALVAISGVAEIAGGVGLLVPLVRLVAAIGLIALYIAVFPANVYMLTHHIYMAGIHSDFWLWLRLPLQVVLIGWAWWVRR